MNNQNINTKIYESGSKLTKTDWIENFFEKEHNNGFLANAIFLYVSVAINFISTFFSILTYLDPTKLIITFVMNLVLLGLVIAVNFTRNKACVSSLFIFSIINFVYSMYIGSNFFSILLVVASIFSVLQMARLDINYKNYIKCVEN